MIDLRFRNSTSDAPSGEGKRFIGTLRTLTGDYVSSFRFTVLAAYRCNDCIDWKRRIIFSLSE